MTRSFPVALILAAVLAGPALAEPNTTPDADAAPGAPAPAASAPDAGAPTTSPPQDAAATPASPEQQAAAYASARNQLGVLTYCKAQGHIGDDAITVQQKMLTMMPAGDAAAGDAAEAKGAGGTVSAMGTEMTLADGAQKQSTTEEALCQQMESMLKELGTQLPG